MKSVFIGLVFIFSHPGFSQWSRVAYPGTFISAFHVAGDTVFAGSNSQIFQSTNGGDTWQDLATLSTLAIAAFASIEDTLLVSTERARSCDPGPCDPLPTIFRSTDRGLNWTTTLSAIYGAKGIQTTSSAVYSDPDSSLFRSVDHGVTWQEVPLSAQMSKKVNHVFAWRDTLFLYIRDLGVYKSTDAGGTWIPSQNGLPAAAIFSMTSFGASLYAVAAGEGVYLSPDGGGNWGAINGGISEYGAIHTVRSGPIGVFAASGDSVFFLRDGSTQWKNISAGLNPEGFRFVATIAASDSHLFAGTNDGIWRRPLADLITSTPPASAPPSSIVLHQNYPNPFNPSTIIRYDLPSRFHVTIRIYNSAGQLVATLEKNELEAGTHEVVWDATGLPSGVYLCRLEAGNVVKSRKLILMR